MEPLALNLTVLNRENSEELISVNFSTKVVHNHDSLLIPLMSSIDAVNNHMQNGHFRELHGEHYKLLAYNLRKFSFIVQTKISMSSTMINSILKDLGSFLEFIYGPCDKWDSDVFNLKGTQNIMRYLFESLQADLGILIGGYKQLHLQKHVSDHLEWLQMQFESQGSCRGSNTMLLLDDVVLNTRVSVEESRFIVHLIKSRKSKPNCQYIPCFVNGSWKSLYIFSIEPYTFATLCPQAVQYSEITEALDGFRLQLSHSRLDIPVEDVKLPLRQFAKRDTLALLYHNVKTGLTLMPLLRPGPELQSLEIMKGLMGCINESSSHMQVTGTSEWIVYRRQHMYFARSDGVDRLFLLISLANSVVGVDDVFKKADDIVKSIRKLYHQL